jgi:hypothetical protein
MLAEPIIEQDPYDPYKKQLEVKSFRYTSNTMERINVIIHSQFIKFLITYFRNNKIKTHTVIRHPLKFSMLVPRRREL